MPTGCAWGFLMNPHVILNEKSNWPYDLEDKYSVDYLLSKMPVHVKDSKLKMLKSGEGYEFWYSHAERIRGEDKRASDALCRLAIVLINLKRK